MYQCIKEFSIAVGAEILLLR